MKIVCVLEILWFAHLKERHFVPAIISDLILLWWCVTLQCGLYITTPGRKQVCSLPFIRDSWTKAHLKTNSNYQLLIVGGFHLIYRTVLSFQHPCLPLWNDGKLLPGLLSFNMSHHFYPRFKTQNKCKIKQNLHGRAASCPLLHLFQAFLWSHTTACSWRFNRNPLLILTFGGVAPAVALRVVRQREQVDTGSSSAWAKHSDT